MKLGREETRDYVKEKKHQHSSYYKRQSLKQMNMRWGWDSK
jgi:hypothetical protein